jgi:xanthine dehydrogenase YagS FAD-binding subunit
MTVFTYERATNVDAAIAAVAGEAGAVFLAGGTTQTDLMLKDAVLAPARVVDITRLPLRGIAVERAALHVGALTTMEELATHPIVVDRLPLLSEALLLSASVQLRNMATIGGNLLQRTRCRYFRDPTVGACNKRNPGSGCAAISGAARMHAILGTSDHCIALHASDMCVALVALDAIVHTAGPDGARRVPLRTLYLEPGETPEREHVLEQGELITEIEIPLLPAGARSMYLKVRDRTSYEFALASAAVALVVRDGVIVEARIGLGGVGTVPWRAEPAEGRLIGASVGDAVAFRSAARAALDGARTVPGTAFKVELAQRTVIRVLETLTEEVS